MEKKGQQARDRSMMRKLMQIGIMTGALSAPAQALEPLPACHGVIESGMEVALSMPLERGEPKSGIVIEIYSNAYAKDDENTVQYEPPVEALRDFYGQRVVHCASGRFLAFTSDISIDETAAALTATEFLRADIKAGRPVSHADLRRAVTALYGKPLLLQENEETCSCSAFFPESRPAGMTPYADRKS